MTNEEKARKIDSLEIFLSRNGQTGHEVLQAQAERTRLLREVPEHVMRAHRDAKRANGKRANETGITYDQGKIFLDEDECISGWEARMLAAKLAAKRAEVEECKKKDKAAALLQWAAAVFLWKEERKRKRESE